MAITVKCACNKLLRAKDELAGKRVRCPACQALLMVPEEELPMALLEEEPPVAAPVPRPSDRAVAAAISDDDDDSSGNFQLGPPPLPNPAPKRKSRRPSREDKALASIRNPTVKHGWFGINGGMGGGLAMMAIAFVWFVGGLMVGFLFYYPPILFIIGLIAFFKGMANSE